MNFKPISAKEFNIIRKDAQRRLDCYLHVSTKTLERGGENARRSLAEFIQVSPSEDTYKFAYHMKNKEALYEVNTQDREKYSHLLSRHNSNLTKSLEISVIKLIQDNPFVKSLIIRFKQPHYGKLFEFNIAGKFLKIITGVEPISIGDKTKRSGGFILSRRKVKKLLDKIADKNEGNFSFVAGTADRSKEIKPYDLKEWHYYVIKSVDKNKKEVTLINPRMPDKSFDLKYSWFLNEFRSITGYFDEMLKK